MTNEADKPSVERLIDDFEYAVLARSQGQCSAARIKECRERLASEAAPAAQPATPLREVLSDEQIDKLWLYRTNLHGGDITLQLRDFARALLAASSDDRKLMEQARDCLQWANESLWGGEPDAKITAVIAALRSRLDGEKT